MQNIFQKTSVDSTSFWNNVVDLVFGVSQEQVPDGENDPLSDERVLPVSRGTVQNQLDSLCFSNLRKKIFWIIILP